jgi:hypothetical protein
VSVQRKKSAKVPTEIRSHTPVVLEVSATEVIPVICTTKFHHLSTGQSSSPSKLASCTGSNLHFYLVDCRPESIASEQGRFPTAVTLSPEKLQDPDELQKLTDMFESLRGTVHVCVMVRLPWKKLLRLPTIFTNIFLFYREKDLLHSLSFTTTHCPKRKRNCLTTM